MEKFIEKDWGMGYEFDETGSVNEIQSYDAEREPIKPAGPNRRDISEH
jgi:hypothetical protein